MDLIDDIWTDITVSLLVVFGLPFYIGYIDSPLEVMLFYAIVAGLGLALGERLLYTCFAKDGVREFIRNACLRSLAVLTFGVPTFALAIWLI